MCKNRFDYDELKKIKTSRQIEAEKKAGIITSDIHLIDNALESDDKSYLKKIHISIDGKYQSCIKMWPMGLLNYDLDYGMDYEFIDVEVLKHNLSVMKPKLEAFRENWNSISAEEFEQSSVNVSVHNTNNNSVGFNMTFEAAKQAVEEMGSLNQEETEEIQSKIDELEKVLNEELSKKKKWEKVKPILAFALNKGMDIANMILSLYMQKKLG